ncbi:uncharacterized protein LODBEIA_P27870 [Lodderomyces beijingensis]|uniref:ADP-ribosylation factor n=1 Tax=Lodderomyces beijingensis TaxID=1775926 RepID=A0ABP0ZK83_9ASCO
MGLLSIIRKQNKKDKIIDVLILGLDNSGKTTITKRMFNEDVDSVSPTVGFQITPFEYGGYSLSIWDVGGQTTLRAFWGGFYDSTDVVLWVIDGLSTERLEESFSQLNEKIVQQDRLAGIYLLVVINKCDLIPEDKREPLKQSVSRALKLQERLDDDHWHLSLVSGKTGEGVDELLKWVVSRDY